MDAEREGRDHGRTAYTAAAPVGHRRISARPVVGAVTVRPMSADAEIRFRAAMQRALAILVDQHLQGREEEQT